MQMSLLLNKMGRIKEKVLCKPRKTRYPRDWRLNGHPYPKHPKSSRRGDTLQTDAAS